MILPQGALSQRGSVSTFAERLVADDPPRLYLPEDEPGPNAERLTFRVRYHSEAERLTALVGPRDLGQTVDASTDHALLVLLGDAERARDLGLIERLLGCAVGSATRAPSQPHAEGGLDRSQDTRTGCGALPSSPGAQCSGARADL